MCVLNVLIEAEDIMTKIEKRVLRWISYVMRLERPPNICRPSEGGVLDEFLRVLFTVISMGDQLC